MKNHENGCGSPEPMNKKTTNGFLPHGMRDGALVRAGSLRAARPDPAFGPWDGVFETVRVANGDPAAMPLIDPNYWADPYDRACALKGLELAREILRQPALKPYVLAERLPGDGIRTEVDLIDYAHRTCKTDHHPVGTCAMGTGADAVTTLDLRVRGLMGLRVVDASVMPFVPSCNTNAPTIMVAEKAADMILGRAALPPADL